jgi:large subunit ribosomal protein L23
MAELHMYDIIHRPVITEKSNMIMDDHNQYVFEVALSANKIQVREAVEFIFDVKVERVRTMIMPAKRARRGRTWYRRLSQWKKAVVTLAPGESIKLFEV